MLWFLVYGFWFIISVLPAVLCWKLGVFLSLFFLDNSVIFLYTF